MIIGNRRVPQQALLLYLSLFYVVGVQAETVEVIGATGIRGANGVAGEPAGSGTAGGPGADVTVVAAAIGDPSNTAIARGGYGGTGGRGGDGVNPDDPFANVNGGNGGDGGRGGDASATATTLVTAGDASATARAAGNYGGNGGAGGDSSGTGVYGTYGSMGPSGNAVAAATATAPGNVRINVDAYGAPGTFVFPDSAGIAGGTATLGTVFGTSTGGGDVDIVGSVTGGSGSGPGAPGASAHLDNAIDGSTSGYLNLYQIAEAGATEAYDAPAGDASSVLTKTASLDALQLTAEAIGGAGYLSGSALSTVVAENNGGLASADARAEGGSATTPPSGARAGDAIAAATARSAGGADAFGSSTAGGGHNYPLAGTPAGVGGSAASTTVVSSEGSLAYADSIATGGNGGGAGGAATATATVTAGIGGLTSGGIPRGATTNVFARGGIGTGSRPDGSAMAHSSIVARGDNQSPTAFTRAEGGSGEASAEIDIANGALTAGLVTVFAPIAGDGTTRVKAYTRADAFMAQNHAADSANSPQVADYLPYQSGAKAYILPSAAYVASAVLGNATVAATIDPSSPGLLYAILGGGYASDGVGMATTFSSSIALSFDPAQLAGGDTLVLGLLDPISSGNGFGQLRFRVVREDVTVFDQSFSDAASALALFDDYVFDLGNWRTDLQGDLDLRFLLDLTASRPGDAFYTSFVATTVPLPPSFWLLGTGVIALVRYRSR